MKTIALVAILAATADARLKSYPGVTFLPEDNELVGGIAKGDLMQNNPSHWRKHWPEGDTDNGNGDAEVLDMFKHPRQKKDKKDTYTYPWTYDEDVIKTGNSLALSEEMTGKALTHDGAGYSNRGVKWAEEIEMYSAPRTYDAPPHSE